MPEASDAEQPRRRNARGISEKHGPRIPRRDQSASSYALRVVLDLPKLSAPAKDGVRLRHASAPSAFLAAPIGTSITGRSFAVWVQSPERLGAIHTSIDAPRELDTLAALLPVLVHPQLAPRYDILHDLGELRSVDESRFVFLEGALRTWIDALAQRVRRLAIVRPSGLVGAAVAGLVHDWVVGRIDARLFHDREQAHTWLAMSAVEVDAIERERDALVGPELLRRVREVVADDHASATLASVAAALGTGARTLQRTLQRLDTSVRDEILRGRIDAAKAMLRAGDDKIAAIAQAVGFASNAAFCVAFQKQVGVTPSCYRGHRRDDARVRRTTDAPVVDAKP